MKSNKDRLVCTVCISKNLRVNSVVPRLLLMRFGSSDKHDMENWKNFGSSPCSNIFAMFPGP